MRAIRMTALLAASIGLVGVTPQAASGYTVDTFPGYYATEYGSANSYLNSGGQKVYETCVSASALTHIDAITGSTDVSRATVDGWFNEAYGNGVPSASGGTSYNRAQYPGGKRFGLDARAWAKLLWYHSPSNYGFNDYPGRSVTWSQADTNAYVMMGIRTTRQPVGAMVDAGIHAVDVVGFASSADPLTQPVTLNGFYVVDPWYATSGGKVVSRNWSGNGGTYNLAPNTYLTIANWNAHYFLRYNVSDPAREWTNKYVVVLRTSVAALPSDNPGLAYSDTYTGKGRIEATPAVEPTSSKSDLAGAVLRGMERNGLIGSTALGTRLKHPTIGPSAHVDSLNPAQPSYYLVVVRDGGREVALAQLNESARGVEFAGLRAIKPGYRLPDRAVAAGHIGKLGVPVRNLRLVWVRSEETLSPFVPLWSVTDGTGRRRILTLDGALVGSLHDSIDRAIHR